MPKVVKTQTVTYDLKGLTYEQMDVLRKVLSGIDLDGLGEHDICESLFMIIRDALTD